MKKTLLYVMLAVCALGANAQEMTPEEAAKLKKEMNDIKRSEDFIFADGLAEYLSDDSDKAVSQATQQSMMKLQTQIVTVFAQHLKMSKEDVQEIWDVIEDKCQNVEITTSGVARSFFYVSKEVLAGLVPDINLFPNRKKKQAEKASEFLADNAQEQQAAAPVAQPATEPEAEATTPVVAQVAEEEKAEPEVKAGETVAVADEKKEEGTAAAQDSAAAAQAAQDAATAQPVGETKTEPVTTPAEPVTETPAKETPAAPVAPAPAPATPAVETPAPAPAAPAAPKVEVPELCQTMLAKKNYEALLRYLNEEKAYENLIFGPERRMTRAAECYIVIINKTTREIITVLDKGVNDRMNFVTGKMDSFSNYQLGGDYLAIFVQKM